MTLFLWVEHTVGFKKNTGIQRVVRSLARSLQEKGETLIPLKWGVGGRTFSVIGEEGMAALEKWNGPNAEQMGRILGDPMGHWFLIPELVTEPHRPSNKKLMSVAHDMGMRVAVIFYDALPHKLASLYPVPAVRAHRQYMRDLIEADRVLPISLTSGKDLLAFWEEEGILTPERREKVKPCPLAGEFFESPRVTEPSRRSVGNRVQILCVGTVEPRKNHIRLIQGFSRAVEKAEKASLRLVIAGGCSSPELQTDLRKRINARATKDIAWEEEVDDHRLSSLYQESDFTVYPSLDEGFGLPVVESLWHGRPVVCSGEGAINETAAGGGCLTADVRSVDDLSHKILSLSENTPLREELTRQACRVPLKSWTEYAKGLVDLMPSGGTEVPSVDGRSMPGTLFTRPLLSICITTYNRAAWLAHSLPLILEQTRPYQDMIEVVVCDNTSTDNTPAVVQGMGHYANLYFYRNEKNVGMLGNLSVSSRRGRGRYIWVIGDDDLLVEGTLERILAAIVHHPDSELLYLNYAFTHFDQPKDLVDVRKVIDGARAISDQFQDEATPRIARIAAKSENCFTAIYCLIFRADHARRVYSQDTSGPPFSTLMTCVPTADYICRNMFDRPGYWIGDPGVVVNMNVSWIRYASLYILERFPELFELMEEKGADPREINVLRARQIPNMLHYFNEIYFGTHRENIPYFSAARMVRRFQHLPLFREHWQGFANVYQKAFQEGLVEDPSFTPEDFKKTIFNSAKELVP